jgi:hypothetical protein
MNGKPSVPPFPTLYQHIDKVLPILNENQLAFLSEIIRQLIMFKHSDQDFYFNIIQNLINNIEIKQKKPLVALEQAPETPVITNPAAEPEKTSTEPQRITDAAEPQTIPAAEPREILEGPLVDRITSEINNCKN